ncbi:MAG: hypothetical protein RIE24_26060, partial [Silicimonas sp.]
LRMGISEAKEDIPVAGAENMRPAEAAAADTFKLHARIRADEVNIVSELPENAELIVNQKDR